MKRAHVAAALLAALSTSLALAAGGKAMQEVSEQIQVETRGGKVLVRISFDNRGAQPVHLPKAVAEDGELFGKHFELSVVGGQEVAYIGPKVKRAPFGPDDYLTLKPHSKHRSTIDITRAYDFLPGQHVYQLRYEGNYVADLKQIGAVTPVQTTPVTFTLTRP